MAMWKTSTNNNDMSTLGHNYPPLQRAITSMVSSRHPRVSLHKPVAYVFILFFILDDELIISPIARQSNGRDESAALTLPCELWTAISGALPFDSDWLLILDVVFPVFCFLSNVENMILMSFKTFALKWDLLRN